MLTACTPGPDLECVVPVLSGSARAWSFPVEDMTGVGTASRLRAAGWVGGVAGWIGSVVRFVLESNRQRGDSKLKGE